MTETSTKFQKTKTTKTEQKTTDKLPTAGQRVVHFRALACALAIIGVAAACGLSVCPPLVLALHMHCACAHRRIVPTLSPVSLAMCVATPHIHFFMHTASKLRSTVAS